MRVAVIGGTGLVGRHTTTALRHAGHDAIVVARSTGIDVTTGAGLDAALAGVQAVVDVTNTLAQDATAAQEFFGATTGMAGEVLLPGPDAHLAPTTFDAWLTAEAASTA